MFKKSIITEIDEARRCRFAQIQHLKELDELNPGTKFFFTQRNVDDWIKSVHNYYSLADQILSCVRRNKFPNLINITQHNMTETTQYDVLKLLYTRHAEMIQEYFKDRPHDLFVLDFHDGGDINYKINAFLGMPYNTSLQCIKHMLPAKKPKASFNLDSVLFNITM